MLQVLSYCIKKGTFCYLMNNYVNKNTKCSGQNPPCSIPKIKAVVFQKLESATTFSNYSVF